MTGIKAIKKDSGGVTAYEQAKKRRQTKTF